MLCVFLFLLSPPSVPGDGDGICDACVCMCYIHIWAISFIYFIYFIFLWLNDMFVFYKLCIAAPVSWWPQCTTKTTTIQRRKWRGKRKSDVTRYKGRYAPYRWKVGGNWWRWHGTLGQHSVEYETITSRIGNAGTFAEKRPRLSVHIWWIVTEEQSREREIGFQFWTIKWRNDKRHWRSVNKV